MPLVALLAAGAALAISACGDDGEVERQGGDTTGAGTTGTAKTGTTTTGGTGTGTTAERGAQPSGPVAETVEIKETEYALDPSEPKISRAGVIEFNVVNDGKVDHALEVEGPEGEVETAAIKPGSSARLKADLSKPGKYAIYCPIADHRERGMGGTITVAGKASEGGGAAAPDVPEKTEDSGGGY